eukprot:GHUV01032041.1.p3 GENE.GHUV01032041.1~~GHUV01032041.1.p3  ORF type:complete len:113 (-),score=35.84 GHUV01032041.1:116-454(-)
MSLVLQVEVEFLPWLTQQAVSHLEQGMLARTVVAQIVADAVALKQNREEEAIAMADAQAAAAEAYAAKVRGGAIQTCHRRPQPSAGDAVRLVTPSLCRMAQPVSHCFNVHGV